MGNRDRKRRRHPHSASKRERQRKLDVLRTRVNVIADAPVSERAGRAAPAPANHTDPRHRAAARPAGTTTMPEDVRRRFIAARNIYYFPGGARAFVDRGDALTTRSENIGVIRSLVTIAQARGWRQVTLEGTERFKRQMWLAARRTGLTVRGYRPDAQTQSQFDRERQREAQRAPAPASTSQPIEAPAKSPPSAAVPEQASVPAPREWRGRLIDHGAAPYRHEAANGASYFVKLQTRAGAQEIWGVDLRRALQTSVSRPVSGDEVVLRRVGHEEVRLNAASREEQGDMFEQAPRLARRNHYRIETRDFFEERARLARVVREAAMSAHTATHRHPSLAGTYLQLHVAQLLAPRLPHPEDQRGFLHRVRRLVADSIARGEPLPELRIRERTREPRPERPVPAAGLLRG